MKSKKSIIDLKLSKILGDTYGGPSLSYDNVKKLFVIYRWYDAPVNEEVLGSGKTINAAIKNYYKNLPLKE